MDSRINLCDLVSLSEDYKLSQKYVKYLLHDSIMQYRHEEIRQIKEIIDELDLNRSYFDGFYYSFLITRLNKEFDLIKITNKCVINIELKSVNVGYERILKQLQRNKYYLRLISNNIYNITYVSKTHTLLMLVNDKLVEISFEDLKKIISSNKQIKNVDLDSIYSIENISASPIFMTKRFINGEYVLTEAQFTTREALHKSLSLHKYVGLTGQTGTGKTLLIYDFAKNYRNEFKILILDTEKLKENQKILQSYLNIIIESQYNLSNLDLSQFDLIIIDEAHKIEKTNLDIIVKSNIKVLFSYDRNQIFTFESKNLEIINYIEDLCLKYIYNLSFKVRLRAHISAFLDKLYNLSANRTIDYNRIHILYFNDYLDAIDYAKSLKDICYIDYDLNIYYNQTNLKESPRSNIYGKEFQNICMIMDDRFFYLNNKLQSIYDEKYNYKKMLMYNLSKARNEIYLLVVGKKIMKQIEKMM